MGDQQVAEVIQLALNKWTLLTAGGIFILIRVLSQSPLAKLSLYRRLLPVLPESFGVASALLGGIPVVAEQGVVLKIAAGLWCGYLSQRFHKVLGQTILGDDRSIDSKSKPAADAVVEGDQ